MNNSSAIRLVWLLLWCIPPAYCDQPSEVLRSASQRLQQATVRILSGTDRASGVLIADSGLILTVAHGLPELIQSDTRVRMVTYDGQELQTAIVTIDRAADVALLKLTSDMPDSAAVVHFPSSTTHGDQTEPGEGSPVLACGFPGRERNGLKPVLRLGTIVSRHGHLIRSTCALTAGDSGGPLVTPDGRLAGIHSRIGLGVDSNHHISTTRIVEFLRTADVYDQVFVGSEPSAGHDDSVPPVNVVPFAQMMRAFPEKHQAAYDARSVSVEIPAEAAFFEGTAADDSLNTKSRPFTATTWVSVAGGTLIDPVHVATKLSLLRGQSHCRVRMADDRWIAAELLNGQQPLDLALLRLAQAAPESEADAEHVEVLSGQLVLAVSVQNRIVPGIIARTGWKEPGQEGRLGAVIREAEPGGDVQLWIDHVSPNSTASQSGLQHADRLVMVNSQAVQSLDQLGEVLAQRQPGDWLQFEILRNDQTLLRSAALGRDPGRQFVRAEFLDGRSGALSDRRTGFDAMIQHDIPLRPGQCGSPLFNDSGQLIGVNIARRAREATLALPLNVVRQVLRSNVPIRQP